MRNKIYSERRRKIYRLLNQVLKNSLFTKLIQKDQKYQNLEIDTLTGVYNQFAINQFLKELHPQELTQYGIILLNIDNFSKLNEEYNQHVTNEILVSVAQQLSHNIRDTDLVGRFSDSEFILILNDINQQQVIQIAERLLIAIRNDPIKVKNKLVHAELSYGVSISEQNTKSHEVLQQADQNRFAVKSQGFHSGSQKLS